MKIRLTFNSGVLPASAEYETDLDVVPFLESMYGTSVAFGNMGGSFEVLESNPEPVVVIEEPVAVVEPVVVEPVVVIEEPVAVEAPVVIDETPALVPDALIVPAEEVA